MYAIHTYVPNQIKADMLVASLDQILETYQVLNKFHKLGKLKLTETKQALFSMKRFLEDFANAIGV